MTHNRVKFVVFEKWRSQQGWSSMNEGAYWRQVSEGQEEPDHAEPSKDTLMELVCLFVYCIR